MRNVINLNTAAFAAGKASADYFLIVMASGQLVSMIP
jgi:hypothetical protein